MSNTLKILLINIGLFAIIEPLSVLIAFLAGYAASGRQATAWRLYIGFIIFHLLINIVLLKQMKMASVMYITISSIEILILYGIVAWIYR